MHGSDPEFFILDPQGRPVPAHRFFSAKTEPNQMIFRDGYAVELNPYATECRALVAESMRGLLLQAQQRLPKGYRLVSAPTVKINLEEDLADAPPDVLTFGCRPSICAYTGQAKTPPIDARTYQFRHAGGHMWHSHYAECPDNPDAVRRYVKRLDLFVGLPLAVLFPTKGTFARRQFYGQAGEYRTRQFGSFFGVEYRTPGPEVWNHPALAAMVMLVMRVLRKSGLPPALRGIDEKLANPTFAADLRGAINTGHKARQLLHDLPDIYTADMIRKLAHRRAFREFELVDVIYEFHTAWTEYVALELGVLLNERAYGFN